jgi:hypothetical protein
MPSKMNPRIMNAYISQYNLLTMASFGSFNFVVADFTLCHVTIFGKRASVRSEKIFQRIFNSDYRTTNTQYCMRENTDLCSVFTTIYVSCTSDVSRKKK